MTELLPSLEADRIRTGLVDFLTTTFALADAEPRQALNEFLEHPDNGIFKGPYVRLRLPFRKADDTGERPLDWQPPFEPYRHQEEAYRRLTTKDLGPDKLRPLPTVVTTGTGSGKTEAFLNPIIDHVLRARRDGVTGMKALILYPMNALADDQADRLTKLIMSDPALANVTAGLYTGDARDGQGQGRSKVTADGLITNRTILRDTPPDILLTNYKMLDQLLLRPDDVPLWEKSVLSLTYLVLDEFHTYDGAQGTDVAMLLRRLGLRLRSHVTDDHPAVDLFHALPLGKVTPVATSATLGDGSDPTEMLDFAAQVFGEPFTRDAAITERRVDVEEFTDAARTTVATAQLAPRRLGSMLSTEVDELAQLGLQHVGDGDALLTEVVKRLYDRDTMPESVDAATLLRAHDDVRALIDAASDAAPLGVLAADRFGTDVPAADAQRAIATVLAALSRIRLGRRDEVSVEVTLWVREVTRLDRTVSSEPSFRWSDDGPPADDATPALPAIYCRSCGRSGWGVSLAPTGRDLAASDSGIRADHVRKTGRFRALLHAPGEAALVTQAAAAGDREAVKHAPNLRWLHMQRRTLLTSAPADDDPDLLEGRVLPVVMLDGETEDVEKQSRSDRCPSCGKDDQIRFLGSAIATLLSVTLSTLFGDPDLDSREKRALIFTDSVQDAAHRAGFVDTRSHTLSLRSALRTALTGPMSLVDWTDEVLRRAEPDPFARYRLVPRALVDHEAFIPWWRPERSERIPVASRTAMRRRLLFDVELEVGLQSTYGRTLEATGSVAVHVDAGPDDKVLASARRAVSDDQNATLPDLGVDDRALLRWVHGTLDRLRRDGAIDHEWLTKYVKDDGARVWIWGKRNRTQGAPAFPSGRGAPAYAVTDGTVDSKSDFVRVTSPQSWYARWTAKCLGVNAAHGASLAARLLKELAARGTLSETNTDKQARAFGIPPSHVVVTPLSDEDLRISITLLVCDTCRSPRPTTPSLGTLFEDGPCPTDRCQGRLRPVPGDPDTFYRRLFATADMRRVDAHEHTGLIDGAERRMVEAGFKSKEQKPGDPNVLVATPTLEMGIDIGDLTTVMLSSLPDSVAKYLQRVGRAGRLTGSSLALAYVTGRGDQLPRLGDPTSMINGAVRPPATYLDAEEILRRQFIAYVIDDLVRSGDTKVPAKSREALKSADPGSFLGTVVERRKRHARRLVRDFVGTFADEDTPGLDALKEWALAGDSTEDSFAGTIYRAVHDHVRDVEELRRRRREVNDAIPELKERAGLSAASDDDKSAYRSAVGTAMLLKKVLSDLEDAPWISGLEVRGLLPNYSLLDDTVELDVQVSWVDPDTQRFDSDSMTLDRGSARALTELAPGTHFYAHGLEMRVDGIEMGRDRTDVVHHLVCNTCGYLTTLASPQQAAPGACPRCGSDGMADTGQRFDAVRLKRVFSEIRRDDATIDDHDDLRRSTRFEVLTAVDFDPARLAGQWSVEQVGLGVAHYRRLPVRWFNLGRVTGAPSTRTIAGRDLAAPLFRVCEVCGKLDLDSGTNSPREHRAWCPHRNAVTEHTQELALSRELITQGVAISLPPSVTADQFSVPSLQAALLLGLRETMGGSPDHLRIVPVPHPLGTHDGATREALLLHDTVPGGTGYLTDLASPERLWATLLRAATVLEDCPCQFEERAACHRCLLPFTRDASSVTRLDALRALRVLMDVDGDRAFGSLELDAPAWQVTERAVEAGWGESPFEQRFRTALAERLSSKATVKQSTTPAGIELRIAAAGNRQWRLQPQVDMHGTRPDFELTANGGIAPYAIYTDGHEFHATPAHNGLADDASKRKTLRDNGIRVLSIPWTDLHDPAPPAWLDPKVIGALMETKSGAGISQAAVEEFEGGSLSMIEGIIADPTATPRTVLADNLPFLLAKRPGGGIGRLGPDEDLRVVATDLINGAERTSPPSGDRLITWHIPHLAFVARLKGVHPVEIALVLDDTTQALNDPQHVDSWREWLRLSNVLALSDVDAHITVTSSVLAGVSEASGAETRLAGVWSDLDLSVLDSEIVTLAEELASADVERPDHLVEEVDDGIVVDLAWDSSKVVVLGAQGADDDAADLERRGWTVLRMTTDTDPRAVVDAVRTSLTAKKE
ncbi:DEAD/DEAH box helicase [Flexivirga sp. B27]